MLLSVEASSLSVYAYGIGLWNSPHLFQQARIVVDENAQFQTPIVCVLCRFSSYICEFTVFECGLHQVSN